VLIFERIADGDDRFPIMRSVAAAEGHGLKRRLCLDLEDGPDHAFSINGHPSASNRSVGEDHPLK